MTAFAKRHGVAPLLHRALKEKQGLARLPPAVRDGLEDDRRATALVNLRNISQFGRIAQALREQNIPVMALKGLHLAELVYRDISLRSMSDLDILVPRDKLARAVTTVYELGYGFDPECPGADDTVLETKYDVELPHRHMDILLEVHWSLSELPRRYLGALDAIWRSAIPARLGDRDALVMSAEFLLLHVCAHLACHHSFRFSLRALCDIAEIVRTHPRLDWGVVIDHGLRYGWTRGVAAALRLASDHLGAAVPAEVLAALGADVLDPAMLAEAMEHLIASGDPPDGMQHAENLMMYFGRPRLADRFSAIWARIFVPRAELALIYGIPQSSARLSLYYMVRISDLLRRYAASAWALGFSDPRLMVVAKRHARLTRWIGET